MFVLEIFARSTPSTARRVVINAGLALMLSVRRFSKTDSNSCEYNVEILVIVIFNLAILSSVVGSM